MRYSLSAFKTRLEVTLNSKKATDNNGNVTLRKLASHLGLSLTTVSVVVSDSPAAQAIPLDTRKRILAAASELHYRPNYFARSLRKQRVCRSVCW